MNRTTVPAGVDPTAAFVIEKLESLGIADIIKNVSSNPEALKGLLAVAQSQATAAPAVQAAAPKAKGKGEKKAAKKAAEAAAKAYLARMSEAEKSALILEAEALENPGALALIPGYTAVKAAQCGQYTHAAMDAIGSVATLHQGYSLVSALLGLGLPGAWK